MFHKAPDLSSSFELEDGDAYSSIDEMPMAVISNESFLTNTLEKRKCLCLQQSIKFRLGTASPICQQKINSSLTDLVPTKCLPSEQEDMLDFKSQENIDQTSFDSSSTNQSFMLPNHWATSSSMNVVKDLEGFHSENSSSEEFHETYHPEWRSTKLPSDKLEAINRYFHCYLQCCSDEICQKGKNLLNDMKRTIQVYNRLCINERQILEYLLKHKEDCSEYLCISPSCNAVEKPSTLSKLFHCIYNEKTREIKYSDNAKFYPFTKNCSVMHPEDVNRTKLYSFTSPNSISIYYQNQTWAKITVLGDIMEDVLPLLKKIGKLSSHPGIFAIDWLIDDHTIFYSSAHSAEPLKNKLSFIDINVKHVILQLIEAALYLNANDIAFLTWTSENIFFKDDNNVKLTNFHTGSALFYDFDPGIIKCLVFPTILPPEIPIKNSTLEKADVWGVCCLLYELIKKEMVHSHLQHIERNEVWRLLDENGWRPKFTFKDFELQNIFHQGWQIDPTNRISLNKLRKEILDYKNDFQ